MRAIFVLLVKENDIGPVVGIENPWATVTLFLDRKDFDSCGNCSLL